MQRNGKILNSRLLAAIAALGHGELIVISGTDLATPSGVDLLDLSLVLDIPAFCQTLVAVVAELQVESVVLDSELLACDPEMATDVVGHLDGIRLTFVDHAALAAMAATARLVVRTGTTTPYANAVLVGGVTF